MRPGTHLHLGLDVHEANESEPFAPHRTGMDHLCLAVTSRSALVDWHEHLTARGVDCSDVRDVTIKADLRKPVHLRRPRWRRAGNDVRREPELTR